MTWRKKQLYILVALSAASAVALYVIQGAMATGADPSLFPSWFLRVDYILWGLRALVEAADIVFLFSTTPQTRSQAVVLGVLELALLGLIAFTLGPALSAVGSGLTMRQSLSHGLYVAWEFGIGAYTSLLIGAAGFAYRFQPDDAPDKVAELQSQAQHLLAHLKEAEAETKQARSEAEQARSAFAQSPQIVEAWNALGPRQQAGLYKALGFDGTSEELAKLLGISASTVRRAPRALTHPISNARPSVRDGDVDERDGTERTGRK